VSDQHPQSEHELAEFVRSIDVSAPDALHARIDTLAAAHAAPAGARPRRLRVQTWRIPSAARALPIGVGVALAGALALALALLLAPHGSSSRPRMPSPALARIAAVSALPATERAPAQSTRDPRRLNASVDGVAFPYWDDELGWRATGARRELIDGSPGATVFYESARGERIGYTILAGARPVVEASAGRIVWRAGVSYRLLSIGGQHVVAWLRDQSACVLAARGTSEATLLRLASSRV